MRRKRLNINGLMAEIPVIQGGMGVGVSLSGLAGAVAAEGGIGVISAAQPGYNRDGFDTNPLKANLEALTEHIKKAKARAKGGVIGVNIMYATSHYAEYVKCCIESKADLIISGAGLPVNLPELVKGSSVKIAPIVSSIKAAETLLKLWDRKYGKSADAVVVEGPKAGGHLGFSESDLEKDMDFDNDLAGIIKSILGYEEKYDRQIPAIFGGGVYDSGDIDHYLSLGCSGVQIATRFVATEECDAHENFKRVYLEAEKEDVVIIKSPVGMPGRALKNEFVREMLSGEKRVIDQCHGCLTGCDPKTTKYCITKALTDSVSGKVREGLIFCGANVHKIKEVTTVKKIFKELAQETF